MTTSSRDKVKASVAPLTIAGIIVGKTIFLNTIKLPAPKSLAASSNTLISLFNVLRTLTITKGIEKAMCDRIMVNKLSSNFIKVNIDNSDIPNTISGITIGTYIKPLIIFLPWKLYLYNPYADIVPRIVDIDVLTTATIIVLTKDSIKSLFSNSLLQLICKC